MERKKTRDKIRRTVQPEPSVKDGVRHTVLGISMLALGLFLLVASRDIAGPVGSLTYKGLYYLFGTGYYLLPLSALLLSVSFFRATRPKVVSTRILGILLFVISGLGIIELSVQSTRAGLIGWAVATGSTKLLGSASWILFIATILIGIVLLFETSFSISSIIDYFKKGKSDKDEDALDNEADEETESIDDTRMADANEKNNSEEEVEERELEPTPIFGKLFSKKNREAVAIRRADQQPYVPPTLDLLAKDSGKPAAGDIKANSNIIKRTLGNFGIEVEMDEISIGPSITRYALKPAEGVKLSKIITLQNDLSLALAAHPLRVEAPIPGKSLVGIEVPNSVKTTVRLGTMLEDEAFRNSDKSLLMALGKNITGQTIFSDLAKMPHLLIAGTTGSGKSVSIHTLIASLLYRNGPEALRFIMIDPKRVELTLYKNIPHLLTPVITNAKKTIHGLKWAAKEMDRRYDILEAEQARDIKSYHDNIYRPALEKYNKKVSEGLDNEEHQKLMANLPESMPYIVIIIDELADIMTAYPRELEAAIVRIAQMSRAVGIHLVLSTQRPSTEVITGLIKANVPTRVALQVPSQIDSRTIIDMPGAEKLLGAGDMLYLSGETSKPVRLQSAYISEGEVKRIVAFINEHNEAIAPEIEIGGNDSGNGSEDWSDNTSSGAEDDDDLYEEAREVVMSSGKASSSLLQRKLKVGYARAARLLDMLEERGVVGPGSGAKPRDVYGAMGRATDEYAEEFSAQGGPASGWDKSQEESL